MKEEIVKETKFLIFKLMLKKPKTNLYNIISKNHENILGRIYWYGAWRQYCFFPEASTLWNKDCLKDIIEFLEEQNNKKTKDSK